MVNSGLRRSGGGALGVCPFGMMNDIHSPDLSIRGGCPYALGMYRTDE